jgi:hypothetical protein
MSPIARSIQIAVLLLTLAACDATRRSATVEEVPDAQVKLQEQQVYMEKVNTKIEAAKKATEQLRNASAKIQLLLSEGKSQGATPVDFIVTALEGFKNGYIPNSIDTTKVITQHQSIDMTGLGFKDECATYQAVMTIDPTSDQISIQISGCTTNNEPFPLMTTQFNGAHSQTTWNQEAIDGIFQKAVDNAHVSVGACSFAEKVLSCSKMSFFIEKVGFINVNTLTYDPGQDISFSSDYDLNGDSKNHYLLQVTKNGKISNTKEVATTGPQPK